METLGKPPKKLSETQEKEPRYHFKEIAELEKPIENLVRQLKERINAGEYDVLISDDVSGRLVTLALRKVIKERLKKLQPDLTAEQKRESLRTHFIGGGQIHSDCEALLEFFKKIKPKVRKRALLITEFIGTGGSLARIGKIFEEQDIPFDIAAVVSLEKASYYDKYADVLNRHNLFIGIPCGELPKIYGRKELSGIYKVDEELMNIGGAHPRPLREHPYPGKDLQKDINMAREDVNILADQVLKAVW